MMKRMGITLILLSVLLLTACAGNTEQSVTDRLVSLLPGQLQQQSTPPAVDPSPAITQPTAATQSADPTESPAATPQPSPDAGLPVPVTAGDAALELQDIFQQIYDAVNPSVVSINTVARVSQLDLPQGHPGIPGTSPGLTQALGSGFVWDDQGHIVTNNHVIEVAEQVTVTFSDGTTLEADVVGTAPGVDLGVLQLQGLADAPEGLLVPVSVGDSNQADVGQFVVAIGNPYGFQGTLTTGVISALGRDLPVGDTLSGPRFTIPGILQTDASINPGNSGGVLVNLNGQVIGVNTAIESPTGSSVGIGFAIPSAIVNRVVPELIASGEYQIPYLGLQGGDITSTVREQLGLNPLDRGAVVVSVTEGGPAAEAGLRGARGVDEETGLPDYTGADVIVGINNTPLRTFQNLTRYLIESASVGDTITLNIIRDGRAEEVEVTLQARPEVQPQAALEQGQPTPGVTPGPEGSVPAEGGYLGILGVPVNAVLAQALNLDAATRGVLIAQVVPGGPAEQAGLRAGTQSLELGGQVIPVGGDIITAIDGRPIRDLEGLRADLAANTQPGDIVTVTFLRNGQEQETFVTLSERPAP